MKLLVTIVEVFEPLVFTLTVFATIVLLLLLVDA